MQTLADAQPIKTDARKAANAAKKAAEDAQEFAKAAKESANRAELSAVTEAAHVAELCDYEAEMQAFEAERLFAQIQAETIARDAVNHAKDAKKCADLAERHADAAVKACKIVGQFSKDATEKDMAMQYAQNAMKSHSRATQVADKAAKAATYVKGTADEYNRKIQEGRLGLSQPDQIPEEAHVHISNVAYYIRQLELLHKIRVPALLQLVTCATPVAQASHLAPKITDEDKFDTYANMKHVCQS